MIAKLYKPWQNRDLAQFLSHELIGFRKESWRAITRLLRQTPSLETQIPSLIALLKEPDDLVRLHFIELLAVAAELLAGTESAGQILDALRDALHDPSPIVRFHATMAPWSQWRSDGLALSFLTLNAVSDPDWRVRFSAVLVLGLSGAVGPLALNALGKALKDCHIAVRSGAAFALACSGPWVLGLAGHFHAQMDCPNGDQCLLHRAANHISSSSRSVLESLLESIESDCEVTSRAAAIAVTFIERHPIELDENQAIAVWEWIDSLLFAIVYGASKITVFKPRDKKVSMESEQSILRLLMLDVSDQDAALSVLQTAVGCSDLFVSAAALTKLAEIGPAAAKCAPVAAIARKATHALVRRTATLALSRIDVTGDHSVREFRQHVFPLLQNPEGDPLKTAAAILQSPYFPKLCSAVVENIRRQGYISDPPDYQAGLLVELLTEGLDRDLTLGSKGLDYPRLFEHLVRRLSYRLKDYYRQFHGRRRTKRTGPITDKLRDSLEAPPQPDPFAPTPEDEVKALLAILTDLEREVVTKRCLHRESYKEIANKMGLDLDTVSRILGRATNRLRRRPR